MLNQLELDITCGTSSAPKKFRVYFNRKEDYPCIWSIDEGSADTEIRVQWIQISGLSVASSNSFGPQPPRQPWEPERNTENEPTAWFELFGFLTLRNGGAVFSMEKD